MNKPSNTLDIIQLLADLPKTARESVLYSLSGSANAAVINTSMFITNLCEREGADLLEEVEQFRFMNIAEMSRASTENGTGTDWFVAATVNVAWANQLRAIFMATTGKDIGGLQSTLDFMTSKPRLMKQTDAQRTAEFLNTLDDSGLTAADVKTIFDDEAIKRCADMKNTKRNIELVMHALPAADLEDPFSALTEKQQTNIIEKAINGLLRSRNQIMQSVATGRGGADIGDFVFINAAIRQLKATQPSADDIMAAAGRARNEETCPTAPTHNVRLSEIQAQYSIGKLTKAKATVAVREHLKNSKFEAAQMVNNWPAPKARNVRVVKGAQPTTATEASAA